MRAGGIQGVPQFPDPRTIDPDRTGPPVGSPADPFADPIHPFQDPAQKDVGTAEALREREREDEERVVGQAQGVLQHPDVRAWRLSEDGVGPVDETRDASDSRRDLNDPQRADESKRPNDDLGQDSLEERLKRLIEHKMQLQQEKADNLNQAIEAEIRAEEDPAYRGRYAFHTVKASMLTGQISDTEAEIVKVRMELARKKAKPIDYAGAVAAGML